MADAATTATVCVATGVVATPFCAIFGFDMNLLAGGLVGGLFGCVIAQSLIPDKGDVTLRTMVKILIGSVLLAGIFTLIAAPLIIKAAPLGGVPEGAVRLAVGTGIGMLAQPLVVICSAKLLKWLRAWSGAKENSNA